MKDYDILIKLKRKYSKDEVISFALNNLLKNIENNKLLKEEIEVLKIENRKLLEKGKNTIQSFEIKKLRAEIKKLKYENKPIRFNKSNA